MLLPKIVLAMAYGFALTTSTLAQEQSAAFEYWPVARHLRSGQFQAEVWRHDLRNDYNDLAWSNQEPFATPAIAMAKACTSVQNNFDASFSCSGLVHHEARWSQRRSRPLKVRAGAPRRRARCTHYPLQRCRVAPARGTPGSKTSGRLGVNSTDSEVA